MFLPPRGIPRLSSSTSSSASFVNRSTWVTALCSEILDGSLQATSTRAQTTADARPRHMAADATPGASGALAEPRHERPVDNHGRIDRRRQIARSIATCDVLNRDVATVNLK